MKIWNDSIVNKGPFQEVNATAITLHIDPSFKQQNETNHTWETNLMLHMQCFVSPPPPKSANPSTPLVLSPSHCVYFLLQLLLRSTRTLFCIRHNKHCTLQYAYHTNTCRWFWSGRWWCGSVPKQASAGSVSGASGWPSATGWLQRRRHWASPRQKETETPLYLSVSFVDGHNWMAFMIILKHQTRREIHGWVITLTFLHKSK